MGTVDILRVARDRISNPRHWCKGSSSQDVDGFPVVGDGSYGVMSPDAVMWCAWGTLYRASLEAGHDRSRPDVEDALVYAIDSLYGTHVYGSGNEDPARYSYDVIVDFNDDPAIGHEHVMKVFEKAIRNESD